MDWLAAVRAALIETDPAAKCAAVLALPAPPDVFEHAGCFDDARIPGRPERPLLVRPARVKGRGHGSLHGRIALVHAVAHIEFNAINLALDAIQRFPGLPWPYYADWLSVARDEARHHLMLAERLARLGAAYGDLPAHDGLWGAAERTAHDVMVRMALVPRVLEARGLDVTPGMIDRLVQVEDHDTANVLRVILAEEVGHVAIGSRWFRYLCEARGLEPEATFTRLLAEHGVRLRPPFNHEARLTAGFSASELEVEHEQEKD